MSPNAGTYTEQVQEGSHERRDRMLSLRLRTGTEEPSGSGHRKQACSRPRSTSSQHIRAELGSRAHQPEPRASVSWGRGAGGLCGCLAGRPGPQPNPRAHSLLPGLLHGKPGTKYVAPSFCISYHAQDDVLLTLFTATAYLDWEGTLPPDTSTSNWVSCHSACSDTSPLGDVGPPGWAQPRGMAPLQTPVLSARGHLCFQPTGYKSKSSHGPPQPHESPGGSQNPGRRSAHPLCGGPGGGGVPQSRPTLCDPKGCSPPGSSVPGILQARILEWGAMPSSRGPSQPGDRTLVSYTAGGFFTD